MKTNSIFKALRETKRDRFTVNDKAIYDLSVSWAGHINW